MYNNFRLALTVFTLLLISSCNDKETVDIEISIIDHKFSPSEITAPAGKKIRLIVHNNDSTVEEFESIDLKREKIISGNSTTHIILAPLRSGEYYFMGEFHEETAQGKLIVTDQ